MRKTLIATILGLTALTAVACGGGSGRSADPLESVPALESMPVESMPVESMPVESMPVESMPVESPSAS